MKNYEFPFFDTSISNKVNFVNSVSLLNIQSINDFQKKIGKKIETLIQINANLSTEVTIYNLLQK